MQKRRGSVLILIRLILGVWQTVTWAEPLGLPPVPVPADNPQTPEKIVLGDKLFHDTRFSATGEVSCASCHVAEKAFTDSPFKASEGIWPNWVPGPSLIMAPRYCRPWRWTILA